MRERIETGLRKTHGRVDPIDILRMTGRNQIGRIKILPEGEKPERRASIRNIDEILEQQATQALVEEIMPRYATRSGVSGAMPKILIEADPACIAQVISRFSRQVLKNIFKSIC